MHILPASARAATAATLVLLGALLSSCDDSPTGSSGKTPARPGLTPVGIVKVTISGLGTERSTATATGLSLDLTPPNNSGGGANGSIQLEQVSTGSFTEGTRGVDGQRFLYATFRVRNAQSSGEPYDTPRRNLTFLAVNTAGSIPGTPVASMRRFDGSPAADSIAPRVVPTGSVAQGDSLNLRSLRADVLQAFSETELAAMSLPATVNTAFPYGFVASNPNNAASRELPATPADNQFDGLVTFAFRVPLQADDGGTTNGASKDVFSLSMHFLAVDDSETRLTETIEEQTVAGRAAVAARATALSATSVTVLNGSPSTSYPGLRRICGLRTAGTAGAPLSTITAPGAYTHLAFYTEGESRDACAPLFRAGAPSRPAVGVAFPVRVYASDRYGNTLTQIADTAALTSKTSGAPPVTYSPRAALVNGEATLTANYGNYGTDTLYAAGRRVRSAFPVLIAGVVRTWEGDVSTDWNAGGNWARGAPPFPLDTVRIPVVGTAVYPQLVENEAIGGIEVLDGAQINMGPFNLTASSSVSSAPLTGGITSNTGRLLLTGVSSTLSGRVPRTRVMGIYTLDGNLTTIASLQVTSGRLRNTAFRIRVSQP